MVRGSGYHHVIRWNVGFSATLEGRFAQNLPWPISQPVVLVSFLTGGNTQLWPWRAASFGRVCHADDAGIFGGPGPAALLCLVASRLGQAGQQTSAVGAHARLVLYLPPQFDARVV